MKFSLIEHMTGVSFAAKAGEKAFDAVNSFIVKTARDPVPVDDAAMESSEYKPVSAESEIDLVVGTKKDERSLIMSLGALALTVSSAPLLYLSGAAVNVYVLYPIFKRGFYKLFRKGKFTNDLLIILVNILLLLSGHFVLLTMGTIAYFLGSWIQYKAKTRSAREISDLFATMPGKVWLLKEGMEIEVPLEKVIAGDLIVVHPSEIVPADGVIVEGGCQIDQHTLTGEFQYAEKTVDDKVFASTMVVSGVITYRVTSAGSDTVAHQLNEILKHSVDSKTMLNMKGEEWADKTALPIMILGTAVAATGQIMHGIIILKFAIGNTIRIACPLGTLNYMTILTRQGILVKSSRELEKLPEIDTILFDKTGTVTEGKPVVREVIPLGSYDAKRIIEYAAMAEKRMAHPIAEAILEKAEEMRLVIPDISDKSYTISMGVTVRFGDIVITVGSRRFFGNEGIGLADHEAMLEQFMLSGYNVVCVARNGEACGFIILEEALKPEIIVQVEKLRARGIKHFGLVTGDHEHSARRIAKALNFDSYYHGVLPEKKADIVRMLQDEGRSVCFVGDGINDSIALKQADASISFSGASTAAADSANIILLSGGFDSLDKLFDVATELKSNLKQSLGLAVAPSIVNIIGLVAIPDYSVLSAILIKLVGRSTAIANAMYPFLKEQREKEKVES
ncbi:MAG: heavy metal translocating P-type ATPase [Desulfuromonadaceae bacterium]|nr:heavy metal translocating P-type ATPase [Desulfuromonadaceae bacterium]